MNPANNLELMITQPDMYVSALTVVLGDKLLLGEQDLFKSFGFGVAVGVGSFAGPRIAYGLKLQNVIGPMLLDKSKRDFESVNKARALFVSISRIGGSVISAFLFNSLILKKNFQFSQLPLIAGADLMAEYVQTQYSKKQWDDFVNKK